MPVTALRPNPGFDPLLVQWGAPDQERTDHCSYCCDPFPSEEQDPGFVPLIMARGDGWVAEFCDHCQFVWWGIVKFPDAPEEEDDDEGDDEGGADGRDE